MTLVRAGDSARLDEKVAVQYRVILLRAWSRDALAAKMRDALEGYDQQEIISIQTGSDFVLWFLFLVLMRPWAMILVKTLEPPS